MAIVLVVMQDVVRGDSIADELERRGHDVMMCPGPQPARYTCPGARGERCALSSGADLVVLDGWLAGDAERQGVPYWHLLLYYYAQGLPVVALVGAEAPPGPPPDETVVMLPRETRASDIVRTVENLLGPPRPLAASGA